MSAIFSILFLSFNNLLSSEIIVLTFSKLPNSKELSISANLSILSRLNWNCTFKPSDLNLKVSLTGNFLAEGANL